MLATFSHPLADATAPCGGPASCAACEVELWREEAARGRELGLGSMTQGQMAAHAPECNLNENATLENY